MAARLPVTSRDMLHQAEVWQGIQLVREVIAVAADPTAPLADKLALYEQSAVMSAADRQRLRAMIAVVQRRQGSPVGQVGQIGHASGTTVQVRPADEHALADADAEVEADDAYGLQPPMLRYNGRRATERLEATQ